MRIYLFALVIKLVDENKAEAFPQNDDDKGSLCLEFRDSALHGPVCDG